MSENRSNQKQANINPLGDVFGGLADNTSDQEANGLEGIPEHVLAEGEGTAAAENEDPTPAVDAILGAGAEEQEAAPDAATGTAPGEDTNNILAKAAALRQQQSLEPMLMGADADLLKYNAETGQFEPVNEEAAYMLAALGESADIAMVNPLSGSRMAQPMRYSREYGLQAENSRAPVKVATNNDTERNFSMSHYANLEDRLKRVSEAKAAPSGTNPLADMPSEEDETNNQEESDSRANFDQSFDPRDPRNNNGGYEEARGNQRTTSAMLTHATGVLLASSIKLTASAIDISRRSLEFLANTTASALDGAKRLIRKEDPHAQTRSMLGNDLGNGPEWGTPSDLFDPNSKPANDELLATDPITPDIATNSTGALGASAIAERMKEFQEKQQAPAIARAEAIRGEYKHSLSEGLSQIESALKLNEVGQIPLVSSDDFENRLKIAAPENRERAQKAVDGIVQASERYQNETQKFVLGDGESRPLDKLSGEESMKQLDAFDNLASNPGEELEDHQKKLLDHLTIRGQPLTEKLGSMFAAFRSVLQGAASRLGILSSAGADAQHAAGARNAAVNQPGPDTIRQD